MKIRVFSIAWFCFFISICKADLPLNGNWGEWTNCSEPCGGGFIWRTCVSVNASNVAPICNVGSSENRICYLKECETPYKNDGFGPWSEWASYPEDNKQQYRTRDCLDDSKGCEGYKIEIVGIQVITHYRRARYLSSGGQTNISYIPRSNFSSDGHYEEEDVFWIHYQYGDDTVSKIDSCEEVEDDWLQWSSWSSDGDGNETRTRKCKDETKLCRGYNKEKRVKMGPEYTGNPEEHPEDWGPWSEWEILNERRTRKRDCLNKSGPCRGQSEETEITEIHKEVWEIKIVEGEAEEDPNDWFLWSGWTLEAQNEMLRTRVCKNLSKGGPCRGMKTQRKVLVTYVVRNGYEYHADDYLIEEDIESWGLWTEWTEGPGEFMSRRRECLSKQGCRGKSVMIRRKAVVIPTAATTIPTKKVTTTSAEELDPGKLVKMPTLSPTTTPELPPGPLAMTNGVVLTTTPIPVMPTDGNWGQWSDWLPPSGDKHTIMRKRVCDSPPPSNGGQDCIGDDFEIYNETIAVNGEWGSWSTWSEPLDDQNPTKIVRTRQCDNPSPSNGGLECVGDSEQYQDYFISVDGMWSPWSEWTRSETNATQESRTRTCTNPAPLYYGETCQGSDYEQRTVSIPVDGNWSKWGTWSEPTGTQPQETLTRTRFCDNPSPSNGGKECEGPNTETKVHTNPINGGWSPWEEWSQPLPGETTVQRNRFCNNPAPDFGGSSCEGPDSQTKEVILPTNGSWSDWSSWSPVTKLSNPETISRTRECNNPAPANGGSYCVGEDKESKEVYHPVDGGWSEWSSWTDPDESDISTRRRHCDNPVPQHDGSPCFGVEVETKTVARAVNGQWSNWEPWPVPTFETNPQLLTRKRSCNNPVPSNGGLPCEGDDIESKNFTRPIDGNWGQWSEWSPVEGKDQKERKRICDKPEPMFDGKACVGSDTEVVDVLKVIDGGWTEWGPWSTQTFATNPETITRKRFCENPKPANGGKQCEGPSVEDQEIKRPIDGNWGPWSDWIQDSSTEDFLRYRECNNPEPMHDGAPCVGSDVDMMQKPKACPEGYMYIEEVKKCYKLIKRRLNWDTSRGICKKFHPSLQLATIFSQNDQSAISKYLNSQNDSVQKKCFNPQTKGLVWLGAKHAGGSPDGTFYWDVKDDVDPTDNPVDFASWSDKNEATNFDADEDRCVFLKYPDFKWTSGPCGCDEQGTPDDSADSEDDDDVDEGKVDPQDPTNFLDYSVESLTLPDGTPESPEGWEEFGEWTPVNSKESERKRNCLKADNSCKGKIIQRRKKRIFRIAGNYTIDISKDDEENTKDFTQWTGWTTIYNTIMIKTRSCKSPTKRCTGSLKAVKMKKEYRVPGCTWWRQTWNGGWTSGLDFDDLRDYSIDSTDVGVPEVPEDWDDWNFWLKDGPDNWVRNRSCVNAPVGPCRGQYVQKKRVRRWKRVGSWSLDEDKDNEVPDDWNSWAEWTRIKPDILDMWRQYRLCKNPVGPCRGKAIRYKRKSLKSLTLITGSTFDDDDDDEDAEEDSKDVKFEDPTSFSIDGLGSSYGDWDNWSPWKATDTGVLKRSRSCKKSNCIGASEQTKRRRNYVIEGSWEVTLTQDGGQENLEDWFSWSLWTKQTNLELWSRLRTCKNGISGPCRGKIVQYRRKIKSKRVYLYGKYAWNWFKDWNGYRLLKWGALTGFGANFGLDLDSVEISSGNLVDEGFGLGIGIGGLQLDLDLGVGQLNWPYGDWEYDLTGDLAVKDENPDNWDNWNPWEDKGDGWFVRERKCKNNAPDGYCEGNSKQKRRIKIWTLISQWLVEDIGESTGDWLNFGDWQEDGVGLGFWFRARKCKGNNCKGKVTQYRKLSERRWGFGWGWSVQEGAWYKGWGWNWLKKDAELKYSATVSTPETSPSNWKWTWMTGKMRFQIKLLHWWDWIRGNDWKLSKLFQGDVKGQKVKANWKHIRLAQRRWSWSGNTARWSTYRHHGVWRGWTNIRKAGWGKLRLDHKKIIKTDHSSDKWKGKWQTWKHVKVINSGQFLKGSNSIIDSLMDSFKIKLPFFKSGFINQTFETKKTGFVYKKTGFSAFSSIINKFGESKHGSKDSEIGNQINLGGNKFVSGWAGKIIKTNVELGSKDFGTERKDFMASGSKDFGRTKFGSGWTGKIIKSKVQLGPEDFGTEIKDFVASRSKDFGIMNGKFGGAKLSKFEKKVGGFSIQSKSVDVAWRQTGTISGGNTGFGVSGFGGFVKIEGKENKPGRDSRSRDDFKGDKSKGKFKSEKGRRHKRFAPTIEESYLSVSSQNQDLLSKVTDWELWNESGPDFNPQSAECSYYMCSLCELDVGNSQQAA